jgi:alpha-D-xyloside xylohydrolase
MGVSGVSFWGFDIGGFYNCDYSGQRVIPDDEDYIRSVQMGLMSPLSRSHGQSTPREPWIYSETAQKAFLKINKLRYRMLPYLYSTGYETTFTGIPMMRAMLLEYPEDLNVRSLATQYMLGGSVLVAPVFDQPKHNVYLPQGSWVDLNNGERMDGGKWIAYPKNIEVIPMFLRENSMIPMLSVAPDHIADENFQDLTIVMNLKDHLEQAYYDDDVSGLCVAHLKDGILNVMLKDIPAVKLVVYAEEEIHTAVMNGMGKTITKSENCYIID